MQSDELNPSRAIAPRCPQCGGEAVRIIDHGLKRFWRMIWATSRCFCPRCRITWRRHNPDRMRPITRKTKFLPVVDQHPWKVIVPPAGGWHNNTKEFLRTVDHLLASGNPFIKLELCNPRSFTTASFGMILKAYKACRQHGGDLRVCKASKEIRNTFQTTNLAFLLEEESAAQNDQASPLS